jgi:hypothetical protein
VSEKKANESDRDNQEYTHRILNGAVSLFAVKRHFIVSGKDTQQISGFYKDYMDAPKW